MQLLYFIILVLYAVTTSYCTRHVPSVETSLYKSVIEKHPNTSGLICHSDDGMPGSCKKLFLRPHYRYQMKIHLNNKAYGPTISLNKSLCEKHLITFRTNIETFPKDYVAKMFPCLGRRSTIRTNFVVDDYLKKFYLSYLPGKKSYYVFRAERRGRLGVQYTPYEEILEDSWRKFAATDDDFLDGSELLREYILHTVEMYIYWPQEIENIFVNEMIPDGTQKQNQLAALKAPTLLLLCVSILRKSRIPDEAFMVDIIKMEKWKGQTQNIELFFDIETQFNGSPHVSYPCYGKDVRNIPSQNRKYSNMFLISSGPQKDTLFLFSSLANENHYMIRSFIANVNLSKFYPTKNLIFGTYKPNLPGHSEFPRSSAPSKPPRPPAPRELSTPLVPPAPQTQLMPFAPVEQYQLPNQSASYEPPTHSTQTGQFTFPLQPSGFTPPTYSMPQEASTLYTFPAYQATPAGPSTSHMLPAPSRTSTSSENPQNFEPPNK